MIGGPAILGLIGAIDHLYRDVVADPLRWDDQAFGLWLEEIGGMIEGPIDRRIARELRRAVRAARKLQKFCTAGRILDGGDWRSVVDQALGSTAWAPQLEMAKAGLDEQPTLELYEEVQNRFPVVHFTPWMDGVDFDEWLAGRKQ